MAMVEQKHQLNDVQKKTADLEKRLTISLQQQAEVINQLINITGKLEDENKYLKQQNDKLQTKTQELENISGC